MCFEMSNNIQHNIFYKYTHSQRGALFFSYTITTERIKRAIKTKMFVSLLLTKLFLKQNKIYINYITA